MTETGDVISALAEMYQQMMSDTKDIRARGREDRGGGGEGIQRNATNAIQMRRRKIVGDQRGGQRSSETASTNEEKGKSNRLGRSWARGRRISGKSNSGDQADCEKKQRNARLASQL